MNNIRNKEIAKIHIAKQQLGMDEDTYREMLFNLTGKRSAKDLNSMERIKVLEHLKTVGFKGKKSGGFKNRPRAIESNYLVEPRQKLLKKIEAYLADAKREWNYAHAIAKNMFGIDRLDWCDCEQLHKIVAALEYDKRRRQKRNLNG